MDIGRKEYLGEETEKNDGLHRPADAVVFDFDIIFWLVLNLLMMVFIVGGNLLTICAVRICRRLRGVTSNLFIMSLAVSDMIVGLTLPYHMAFYMGSNIGQSHALCLLRFYIIIFACCISVWNLISIAADRYIAILLPLQYNRLMTRRVAMLIIAIGWIVGTSLACIPVFWNHWNTAVSCEFYEVLPTLYLAGIITPSFIIIWVCMLLVYLKIWQEASKQAKELRKILCSKDAPSDWKSAQVVLLIMGGFTICWLPYFIVACVQITSTYEFGTSCPVLYKIVFALAMSNSGLNPLIYAWKNQNFRQSFALLLRCKSPNGLNTSEYSVREHFQRNVSVIQAAATAETQCDSVPTNSLGGEIHTQEPTTTTVCFDPNRQIVSEISAAQLLYRMEENRNALPTLANESYASRGILCSPCEICKLVMGKRTKLGDHIKGTLAAPWKCGEYNQYIVSTIKCRW